MLSFDDIKRDILIISNRDHTYICIHANSTADNMIKFIIK